jgi:hypothetical protein
VYELSGTIKGVSVDYETGNALLTLSINQKQSAINCFDELHLEEKLSFKIDKYKEKRSLNANAYCWVLIGKIADILRISKDDCYLKMLKRYGQGAVVKIPKKYVEAFKMCYPYHEEHEKLKDEETAQYFRFWVGSSNYSTYEMSIFLDGIITEAKDLGIRTETPEQIAKMKALWGE